MLCEALDAAGLETYRVGLGDASLYPSLLAALGVDAGRTNLILSELARGDFVAVEREIRELGLGEQQAGMLLRVPRTRGGAEILEGLDGDAQSMR